MVAKKVFCTQVTRAVKNPNLTTQQLVTISYLFVSRSWEEIMLQVVPVGADSDQLPWRQLQSDGKATWKNLD